MTWPRSSGLAVTEWGPSGTECRVCGRMGRDLVLCVPRGGCRSSLFAGRASVLIPEMGVLQGREHVVSELALGTAQILEAC